MKRVLNIGSLNIDRTYTVEHFVQPKETIKALRYEEFCGGKGLNQSVALARAGAQVFHAGAVGADGDALVTILEESGADTTYLLHTSGASGHAVIQIDESGQNNIIIAGGANESISREYIQDVLEHFMPGDVVLLQNEVSNVDFAIEEAKKRGLFVAFNPSPINDNIWKCPLQLVDLFLVNEIEATALSGVSSEEPKQILEALAARYPNAAFVLTLGEGGAYYFDEKELQYHDIFPVQAVDTTAAGDTFCGYFIAAMAQGLEKIECVTRASAASAIAVTRKGAAPSVPTKAEVEAMLA